MNQERRGRGRPRLPTEQARGAILRIRLQPSEKAFLEEYAEENGISVAALVRWLLFDRYKRR